MLCVGGGYLLGGREGEGERGREGEGERGREGEGEGGREKEKRKEGENTNTTNLECFASFQVDSSCLALT